MPFVYDNVTVRKRRRLPHWEADGGLYMVTFRQLDALPLRAYAAAEQRRNEALSHATALEDPREREEASTRARAEFLAAIEALLDEGHGSCLLADPRAARAAHLKITSSDGSLYTRIAHAIMPNHIHIIFRLFQHDLAETMKRLKGGTSFEINRAIGRRGRLWIEDYYDTLIRDEKHLDDAIKYVVENPQKAGLGDWPWVGFSEEGMRRILGLGGAD